ncbi:MAG: DUF503 family protein [Pseudomonadales bacterium]
MSIASLTITFRLGGCRSLKEKRQRLAGLRDRFGRNPQLAVFESGAADALDRAEWTFVAGASAAVVVEQLLAGIERDVQESVDAEVVRMARVRLT